MTVNELTLLTMYAVAAADGNTGAGTQRIVPQLTGMSLEEVENRVINKGDEIISEISKLPKEAIEVILSVAKFMMHADGIVDSREQEIVSKIENLLA